MYIHWLSAVDVDERIPELERLLAEAVSAGASIGFMLPLNHIEIAGYWRDVSQSVKAGSKHLVVALTDDNRIVGTAQLEPSPKENGRHRAEVQKVIVALSMRNQGIGGALMHAVDIKARDLGRSMLFLDTRAGDIGERLYARMGWSKFGVAPDYAFSPDGQLEGSAFYYKRLT